MKRGSRPLHPFGVAATMGESHAATNGDHSTTLRNQANDMSWHAVKWAIEATGLTSNQRLVLICLADKASHEGGSARPSLSTISAWSGLSKSTVQRTLAELLVKEVIEAESKAGPRGGRSLPMSYRVPITKPSKHGHSDQVSALKHGHSDHVTMMETWSNETENVVTVTTNPKREPKIIPSSLRSEGARAHGNAGRGSRLPGDWQPSAEDRAFAAGRGLNTDDVAARFRDYWHAKSGQGARMVDWSATWRNWCRREDGPISRAGTCGGRRETARPSAATRRRDAFGGYPLNAGPEQELDDVLIEAAAEDARPVRGSSRPNAKAEGGGSS